MLFISRLIWDCMDDPATLQGGGGGRGRSALARAFAGEAHGKYCLRYT